MGSKPRLTEEHDRYTINVVGEAVNRCIVDYAFTLDIGEPEDGLSVRIGCPFSFRSGADSCQLDAERNPAGLGPVLSVVHKAVAHLTISKDGNLAISMTDGSRVAVCPDPDYEAWSIAANVGLKGLNVVCLPGGGLAIWDAED